MDQRRIILVTRKTRLEGLVERFNTREQAKFYIEHSGEPFGLYEKEHEVYHAGLETLKAQLTRLGRLHVIERSFLPTYLFAADDLVVTLGIDGQVVNTAKYLDGQQLIAVNPDPAHIDGILLPFRVDQAEAAAMPAAILNRLLSQPVAPTPVEMMIPLEDWRSLRSPARNW